MSFRIMMNFSTGAVKDMFAKAGRDNFSYEGLDVILNELSNYDENEVIDLDIIEIDTNFVEIKSIDELSEYFEIYDFDNIDDLIVEILENGYSLWQLSNGHFLIEL